MPASSPYAPFRADAWMRESLIRPRRSRPASPRCESSDPSSVVQAELFLFPVVLPLECP